MRVASLLPAATEWLAVLGLGDGVVGVSHECDFPEGVIRGKPILTRARLDPHAPSAEIDRAVRELLERGEDLYEVRADEIARLAPDAIVTQAQCEVCAVSEDQVRAVAARLTPAPRVVVLGGSSLAGVLDDVRRLARACEFEAEGERVVAEFRAGLAALPRPERPLRCALLEWIDPPMGPGSWLPELVSAAGLVGMGTPGQKSRRLEWDEVRAFDPDLIVFAPCGFDASRAERETRALLDDPDRSRAIRATRAFQEGRVHSVDGNALFNRPGPRLLDSARLLARLAARTN